MKKLQKILRVILPMLFLFSCDFPETVITNIVHPDGTVTRRVVMRNDKEEIDPSKYRVPIDSTWTFSKTFEVKDHDTTWIITAEKDFQSVDEINRDYQADSGSNSMLNRSAAFFRKFRWFNTFYRYSEKIEKILNIELKAEQCLTEEELECYYMPGSMIDSLINGPDSLMYKEKKANADTAENKYLFTALVDEWIMQYLKINPDSGYILPRKEELLSLALEDNHDEDTIFMIVLGEDYYLKNKEAITTALQEVDTLFGKALNSSFYTCEILMPFELVSTSGFVDKNGKVSWPVDSKYFVSQDYVMWAESKQTNMWAWAISGVFTLFVLVGLLVRLARKRK